MGEAGHNWDADGRCELIIAATGNPCGRKWIDIMSTKRTDIGQDGIAHIGTLNEAEYDQIAKRAALEIARYTDATSGVATGSR